MESNTNYANENCKDDPMPFVSIAAATANALRFLKLDKQHDEEREDRERAADRKQNEPYDEAYVRQRLAELRRFEKRANGGK